MKPWKILFLYLFHNYVFLLHSVLLVCKKTKHAIYFKYLKSIFKCFQSSLYISLGHKNWKCGLHTPLALPLGKEHRYPWDGRLGGSQSWSGCCGEVTRNLVIWHTASSPYWLLPEILQIIKKSDTSIYYIIYQYKMYINLQNVKPVTSGIPIHVLQYDWGVVWSVIFKWAIQMFGYIAFMHSS